MMKNKISKVVVITGASNGIGLATAKYYVEHKHIVYDLSRHGVSHDGILHITCDITNEENVTCAINQIIKEQGRIDLLINNAGFGISGPVEFTNLSDAKKQFDVNFFGSLSVTNAVVPFMREKKAGRIIFTSSVAAVFSIPFQAFYSAAKSSINALTLALANEVRPFNISVCAIMPGDVSTGFTDNREKNKRGSEIYTRLNKSIETMEHDERNGMSCLKMAKLFYKVGNKKHVKPLFVGGFKYAFLVFLSRLVPTRFFNWVVGKMY